MSPVTRTTPMTEFMARLPHPEPRCFEALDAPDDDEVTCSKSIPNPTLDLKVLAIDLRHLACELLRMSERLKALTAP